MPYSFNDDRNFAITNTAKKDTLLKKLMLYGMIVFAILFVLLTSTIIYVTFDLPSSQEILAHKPSLATVIYDRNGEEITKLFQENRNWVPLRKISPWMVKAILAAEDSKFYEHSGIRPLAILRAATVDLVFRGAHQGGSTITQQLARNLFLTKEKTIIRKIKEAIISLRLEKIYSKDQILEMYLNTIYMGHGAYGIESAARTYYNKNASELTITESAILAGLVAAPEKYSPIRSKQRSDVRKTYVLKRMLDLDWISKEDYDKASAERVRFSTKKNNNSGFYIPDAPYFVSYLLFNYLLPTYGADQVYRGGLKVYTTIDIKVQQKAEELVSKMPHEAALVALDPETGEILAMVGGRNYEKSKFNRATQAYRQPGSAFKPFVYATALENDYRAVDHLLDAPLHFGGWSPSNYSKYKYSGEVTLMTGIAKSLNTVAVRLGQVVGVDNIIALSTRIGISSKHLPNDLSITLGSASVTPIEMCVAYSTFANGGNRVTPFGIKQIEDNMGQLLEENTPDIAQKALSPTIAVLMRSLLQQVTSWGTGAGTAIPGYQTFGKTGTTNDWTDAWFAGGVPGIVAVVYTGNDNHTTLGGHATGTSAAAPIWRAFMNFAVHQLNTPSTFTIPADADVTPRTVCTQTGFLATQGCKATTILLPAGNTPQSYCPWHGGDAVLAKEDEHAPQLILAPVDSEQDRYKYGSMSIDQIQDDESFLDVYEIQH